MVWPAGRPEMSGAVDRVEAGVGNPVRVPDVVQPRRSDHKGCLVVIYGCGQQLRPGGDGLAVLEAFRVSGQDVAGQVGGLLDQLRQLQLDVDSWPRPIFHLRHEISSRDKVLPRYLERITDRTVHRLVPYRSLSPTAAYVAVPRLLVPDALTGSRWICRQHRTGLIKDEQRLADRALKLRAKLGGWSLGFDGFDATLLRPWQAHMR